MKTWKNLSILASFLGCVAWIIPRMMIEDPYLPHAEADALRALMYTGLIAMMAGILSFATYRILTSD